MRVHTEYAYGRRYHRYKPGLYDLPHDKVCHYRLIVYFLGMSDVVSQKEESRLEMLNSLMHFRDKITGHLRGPLPIISCVLPQRARILDLGYGVGLWALEAAK